MRYFAVIFFLLCSLAGRVAAQDLAEGNASAWGSFASDLAPTSVSDDAARVKAGQYSLRFETLSGFDTGVVYPPAGGAGWDLSGRDYLVFWAYAVNDNTLGFQGNQPVVVLTGPGGSFRYEPQGQLMPNRAWRRFYVPLAGSPTWVRTETGTPSLARIDQLEIHQDTWDYGFSVYYDGVEFINFTPGGLPPPGPPPPPGVNPDAIEPRVLLFIYDPIMENKGGLRMHEAYGWPDPVTLTSQIVSDLRNSSHDLVRYDVVDTQIVDDYSYFMDGFRYDDVSFDADWTGRTPHNSEFDYPRFVAENGIAPRIISGDLDEVWVYNAPYSGMWESDMAGDGGYWCNSGPVPGVPSERLFVIMGWNFERGVAEAIHSYGHRAESIMVHSYGAWNPDQSTSWNKFTLLDKDAPGLGGVGNCHFPVNGLSDYDYANTSIVLSNADDWYNYPNFQGLTRSFDYHEWSPLDIDPHREYLNWWYNHMPHFPGRGNDYFLNNWWRYIVDPDQFKGWDGNLYFSTGALSVNVVTPSSGESLSGVVDVEAQASADGALGRVDLYVDDVYFASDTLAPYHFDWCASTVAGPHALVAKAFELQNGTEAVSAPVLVDGAPDPGPTVAADSLRAAKGAGTMLTWLSDSGDGGFNVHRTLVKAEIPSLWSGAPAGATADLDWEDTQGVAAGECAFYEVYGRGICSGASIP